MRAVITDGESKTFARPTVHHTFQIMVPPASEVELVAQVTQYIVPGTDWNGEMHARYYDDSHEVSPAHGTVSGQVSGDVEFVCKQRDLDGKAVRKTWEVQPHNPETDAVPGTDLGRDRSRSRSHFGRRTGSRQGFETRRQSTTRERSESARRRISREG